MGNPRFETGVEEEVVVFEISVSKVVQEAGNKIIEEAHCESRYNFHALWVSLIAHM